MTESHVQILSLRYIKDLNCLKSILIFTCIQIRRNSLYQSHTSLVINYESKSVTNNLIFTSYIHAQVCMYVCSAFRQNPLNGFRRIFSKRILCFFSHKTFLLIKKRENCHLNLAKHGQSFSDFSFT